MSICLMSDLDLQYKQVVLREDLNVPMKNGIITSDTRIHAALPTIKLALASSAGVVILSHLGRPEEGVEVKEYSLAPVAEKLSELLGMDVPLVSGYLKGVHVRPGECILCENVRFIVGEKANSKELAQQFAALGDVYVMDAFATAHRAQASTEGALRFAKKACMGPLMAQELHAITAILDDPKHPSLALVGGSKVSSKLELLKNLIHNVDHLIVGGGIANTFLKAAGFEIGTSLYEEDLVSVARDIMIEAKKIGASIPLPTDVVVGYSIEDTSPRIRSVKDVKVDESIFDIGPETAKKIASLVKKAKTVLWNGPLGVFEVDSFGLGTKVVAEAIAKTEGYTVVGGGDSIAAIEKYGYTQDINYISTAGGAFLEMLEGKELPAVKALQDCYSKDLEG